MQCGIDPSRREACHAISEPRAVRRGQDARRLQVRVVVRASGPDDDGTGREGERRRSAADRARSPFDEERLALQVAEGIECTDGGGGGEPCGCRLRGRPVLRNGTPGRQNSELRRRVAHTAQTEHDVTHLGACDAGPDLVDDADSIPAGDGGQGERQNLREVAGAEEHVDGVHARGVHPDPDRALTGVRFGRVLDDENVGGPVGVEPGSAHEGQLSEKGSGRYLPRKGTLAPIPFRGKQLYPGEVPTPDRLTPQQDRTWSLLVGVMMWLPAELDAYLEQSADLSHAEYGVLRCLSVSEDREIHMSRLAATASVTPSHLSRIVGRLEKRDLLARSADPTDARRTLARLTPGGVRVLEDVEPGYIAEVRARVFDLLGEDRLEQLEDLAEAILTPLRGECVSLLPPRSAR